MPSCKVFGGEQPRRKPESDSQDSRERILAAAARVFSRKGFQRASLDEIAAEAALTKGAIYWHFRSKNDLFSSLLRQRFQHNTAPMPEELMRVLAASDAASRKRGVVTMLVGMIRRIREDADWPRLYLEFLSQSRASDVAGPLRELAEHGRELARGMVLQMQAGGLARSDLDVDMLSAFWCALMDGYLMAWVMNPEGFEAELQMEQLVDMLWRGMSPGQ